MDAGTIRRMREDPATGSSAPGLANEDSASPDGESCGSATGNRAHESDRRRSACVIHPLCPPLRHPLPVCSLTTVVPYEDPVGAWRACPRLAASHGPRSVPVYGRPWRACAAGRVPTRPAARSSARDRAGRLAVGPLGCSLVARSSGHRHPTAIRPLGDPRAPDHGLATGAAGFSPPPALASPARPPPARPGFIVRAGRGGNRARARGVRPGRTGPCRPWPCPRVAGLLAVQEPRLVLGRLEDLPVGVAVPAVGESLVRLLAGAVVIAATGVFFRSRSSPPVFPAALLCRVVPGNAKHADQDEQNATSRTQELSGTMERSEIGVDRRGSERMAR